MVEFHLVPDPGYARNEANKESGSVPPLIPESGTAVAPGAGTSRSHDVLSTAFFRSGDLGHFETAAFEALRQGSSVTIELMHEHLGLSGDELHPATLRVSAHSLAYDPKISM